jgi:hypothetical protein
MLYNDADVKLSSKDIFSIFLWWDNPWQVFQFAGSVQARELGVKNPAKKNCSITFSISHLILLQVV